SDLAGPRQHRRLARPRARLHAQLAIGLGLAPEERQGIALPLVRLHAEVVAHELDRIGPPSPNLGLRRLYAHSGSAPAPATSDSSPTLPECSTACRSPYSLGAILVARQRKCWASSRALRSSN